MSTMTFNLNLDNGDFGEDPAVADSYLASCEIRNIVATVDLIYSDKASFFDHRFCASGSFFRRLEQQSDCLVRRYLVSILNHHLGTSEKHSHVSIMPTHVRIWRHCLISQVLVVFLHRQCINVSSQCDNITRTISRLPSASNINYESCPRTLPNVRVS